MASDDHGVYSQQPNPDVQRTDMFDRDEIDDATRRDYIRAVKCLAAKPSRTDKKLAPGAVNRLDDFTYIHINQTNIIHGTVGFFPGNDFYVIGS